MTVSQARIHHESLLLESGATMMDLSDGSRNPTNNTVSYWYKQWKEIDSGINSGAILVEVRIIELHYIILEITIVIIKKKVCRIRL